MSEALTAQKLGAVRRFWKVFTRAPITLGRLRAGQLDWLMEEFYRRFYETWFATFEEVSFELERTRG
jgi:hypothetical protein